MWWWKLKEKNKKQINCRRIQRCFNLLYLKKRWSLNFKGTTKNKVSFVYLKLWIFKKIILRIGADWGRNVLCLCHTPMLGPYATFSLLLELQIFSRRWKLSHILLHYKGRPSMDTHSTYFSLMIYSIFIFLL